jgi:hypothetical protein
MPCYRFTYTRLDMGDYPCTAIKHAHTEQEALAHLAVGNEKKGYSLKKTGVRIKLIKTEEI